MAADADPRLIEHVIALKAVAPFSALPPDDLALLVERAKPRTLDAGDVLVADGVRITSVHLVLEGRLEEQRAGHRWADRQPYELVGGVDALAHAGQHLVVRAIEPTQTLELDRDELLEVCRDRFSVLATVAAGVAAMAIAARRRLGPTAGFEAAPASMPSSVGSRERPGLAETVARLRAMPAFEAIPIHVLAYAAAASEVVVLDAGRRLWRAGDPAGHLLLISSGMLQCSADDGRQRFALGPHESAGVLDALASAPRWYDATTGSHVTAIRMETAALMDVLEDDPETAVNALIRFACATAELVDRAARAATV